MDTFSLVSHEKLSVCELGPDKSTASVARVALILWNHADCHFFLKKLGQEAAPVSMPAK